MSDRDHDVVEHSRRIKQAILERHGYESEADVPGDERRNALADAAARAQINAHWGIVSYVPILGPFIVLGKRVLRIVLRWYINPIVEQQNAFNDATVRALYALQTENDRLRARSGDITQSDEPS